MATRDNRAAYLREWKAKNPAASLVINARCKAKKDGVAFDVTADDIAIPTHCPILGIELKAGEGKGSRADSTPTLRMIDPALGWTKGNVAVVSRKAYQSRPIVTASPLADADLEAMALDLVRDVAHRGVTPDAVAACVAAFKEVVAKGRP